MVGNPGEVGASLREILEPADIGRILIPISALGSYDRPGSVHTVDPQDVLPLIDEDPEVLQGMAMAISRVVLFHWLRGGMRETPTQLVERIQAHFVRAFFR